MFIVNRIVFVLNSIAIMILLLSYLAPFVSPVLNWQIAFLGLAYPIWIAVNAVFIVYWLVFFNMRFLFSLAALVIGWSYIPRFVQIGEQKMNPATETNTLQLVTFNARYFGIMDDFKSKEEDLFLDKLSRLNPDILCAQEFYVPGLGIRTDQLCHAVLQQLKKYHVANGTPKNDIYKTDNLIIFSKYPMVQSGIVERDQGSGNYTIYADVVKGKDTLRIINTHLQSIGFSKKEYDVIRGMMGEQDSISYTELRSAGSKMKYAYLSRARQVEAIRTFIDQSPYRVLLFGDFNDSPVSYAYRSLKGNMKDAFMEAGSGLGRTYIGSAPSLRIDYIFANPSFQFYNYYAKGFDFSDHKMVSCIVAIP